MYIPLSPFYLTFFVLVVFCPLLAFTAANTNTAQQQWQQLTPTFRTPKNILFACTIGGSSHSNWVLSILKDLEERGHTVTFATKDDHARFGKKYGIETISVGPATLPKEQDVIMPDNQHLDPNSVMGNLIGHVVDAYTAEYRGFKKVIKEKEVDLVICDHFVDSCIEAARFHQLPFIVTSTLAIAPDARSSFISNGISLYGAHNNQLSFSERIYHNYIFTAAFLWKNFNILTRLTQVKTDLGLVSHMDTMTTWQDSLKLVNTAFGLENARALGPLVEFVGPILPLQYQSLTSSFQAFLDKHSNVIYVAFGQKAIPSAPDRQLLWSSLLSLLDMGDIDGIIWADGLWEEMSPLSTFTTKQSDVWTLLDIRSHPHILLTTWAPQVAILQHPSVSVFCTHGGAGSLHESLYSAVPMAVFPFVGDQLGLARNIEEQGLGVYLHRDASIADTVEHIQRILKKDDIIRDNVRRYSALIQIHSQHAIQRGADLVEEVLFTGVAHRFEASRSMSVFKTYNLDVYGFFILITILIYNITRQLVKTIFYTAKSKKLQEKKIQ